MYQPLSQFEAILYSNTVFTFLDYSFFFHLFYFFDVFYDLNFRELHGFWFLYKFYLDYLSTVSIFYYLHEFFSIFIEICLYYAIIILDVFYMNPLLENNINGNLILKNQTHFFFLRKNLI